jgi:hypothetical protein
MSTIIRRAIVPLLLFFGAVASIQYGAAYHSVPVSVEQVEEVEIDVPDPFALQPGLPPDSPFGQTPPFGGPSLGPPPFLPAPFQSSGIKKVETRVTETTKDLPEPALIRDVTVGGVVRLASGELKRTYSGDRPPSLCPT